jgi:hypothetical protein
MKFLCVPCDQPMKLATVAPPDRGSLAVRYSCPACGYEMAMLTNPFETQIVQSLGVRVGPAPEAPARAAAGGAASDVAAGADAVPEGSRCPFAGMIGDTVTAGTGAAVGSGSAMGSAAAASAAGDADPAWTDRAAERMKSIPEFVRPMARTGIERFARERGYATIDEKVLDEARAFFGM